MQLNGAGSACAVTVRVPQRMSAPVFLYYELDGFYQNHRRWNILTTSTHSVTGCL